MNGLITGASRGLGFALANALHNDGWKLIIDSRNSDALAIAHRDLGSDDNIIAIPGDITDSGHQAALLHAAAAIDGLDLVINNAGMLGPSPQPYLLDYPLDVLRDVFYTNVIAPLGILQTLKDQLKPGAVIINVTSDAAREAYEGWGGYGASKAALEQISAVLAVEHPELRVYWVDPGDMRTQMHQEAFPNEDISDRPLPDASVPGFLKLIEGTLPSGRYAARQLESVMI